MKLLIKAKKLHDDIIDLNKDIKKITDLMNDIIDKNLTVKNKFRIINKENPIANEPDQCFEPGAWTTTFIYRDVGKTKKNWDYSNKLQTEEFMIMYGSLINYKKDQRKKLIKEFNNLDINIKL